MSNRKCRDCEFLAVLNYNGQERLECRINPPAINDNYSVLGHFPMVHREMWCGEFKLMLSRGVKPILSRSEGKAIANECPICGREWYNMIHSLYLYCPKCGVKLDWTEVGK